MQRQPALHELEGEQEQDADRREGEHAAGVCPPGLLGLRVRADDPVDHPLGARVLGGRIYPVHVVAERYVDRGQRDGEGEGEQNAGGGGAH